MQMRSPIHCASGSQLPDLAFTKAVFDDCFGYRMAIPSYRLQYCYYHYTDGRRSSSFVDDKLTAIREEND